MSEIPAPVTPRARRAIDRRVGWLSPPVGVVLGLGLFATRWTSSSVLVVVVVVLAQLLVAFGWHAGVQAQQRLTGTLAGLGLGLVADVLVLLPDSPNTLETPIALLGVGFLLVVVQQLARRDAREGVVVSMAATASLATLTTLGAAWIVLDADRIGSAALWVSGLAVALASLARLVPSETWTPWLAVVAGVLGGWLAVEFIGFDAGIMDALGLGAGSAGPFGGGAAGAFAVGAGLVGTAVGDAVLAASSGMLIGLACGIAVGLCDAFVRGATAVFRRRWWMTGAMPVLLAAPLAYLATHLSS